MGYPMGAPRRNKYAAERRRKQQEEEEEEAVIINAQGLPKKKIQDAPRMVDELTPTNLREELTTSDDEWVHIALILRFENSRHWVPGPLALFKNVTTSILKHTTKSQIHFIVFTDGPDRNDMNSIFGEYRKIVKYDKTETQIDFINATAVMQKYDQPIRLLQRYFGSNVKKEDYTYDGIRNKDPLSYAIPFLHFILSGIDSLVLLDLNCFMQKDIGVLSDKMNTFVNDQIMAVTPEISSHYREVFDPYVAHNQYDQMSHQPWIQGFNIGVMLLHLEVMRHSPTYNELLKESKITNLVHKFGPYISGLSGASRGIQDFFSMIGMEHPELFQRLSCLWNFHLDVAKKQGRSKQKEEAEDNQRVHKCIGNPFILRTHVNVLRY